MAQIANTTRLWKTSNIEYRPFLQGLSWTTQARTVDTYSGRCVMDDNSYPSQITGGSRIVSRSTTPRENGWYDYEEVSVTEGGWA